MKTFVFGDIHNHISGIEKFLEYNDHDRAIFLGDYYDMFGDGPNEALETSKWLSESIQKENRIHLMGNHDLPYRWPANINLGKYGWTPKKQKAVSSIITSDMWVKMKFAHFDIEDNIIYSHAGFDKELFSVCPINGPNYENYEFMLSSLEDNLNISENYINPLLGEIGPFWVRPSYIDPIDGVTQIVGHTPTAGIHKDGLDEPIIFNKGNRTIVWDIDCLRNWVGVVEDGEVYCVNRFDTNIKIKNYA